jgi:hypothetical protein
MKTIYQNRSSRRAKLLAEGKAVQDSKGLEAGAYKPLMRKRTDIVVSPAIGSTASNILFLHWLACAVQRFGSQNFFTLWL